MAFARANGPGGQSLGGASRQAIGQIGGQTGGKDNQAGYAAGKEAKGRKIHALVDSEGLPIRGRRRYRRHPGPRRGRAHPRQATRRFRWLGLTWTGGGCNAWQVEALKLRWQRCRSRAWSSLSGTMSRRASWSCRGAGWSSAPSAGSDETGVSPRTSRTLPKPRQPSLPSPPSSLPSGGLPGRGPYKPRFCYAR